MALAKRPIPAGCSVDAEIIVKACELHWEEHKGNCSGFVKAVAAELGVGLSGQANDIVKSIVANWWPIASGAEAQSWAEAGYLVVAGLEAEPNGHVVVVVPGPLANGKYPTAYWGRLGSSGKKNTTLNYSWNSTTRDKVIYGGTLVLKK
ncbi:hypothetical protein SAMN05444166_0989 [Singulisphaera sp. GP187]|uniref:hypothetical protein n=1 Tax=Singulisphaera sp. GP187 TaxID=1882752 RepID=UPI00092A1BA2|nr:hypothetical protein [Singulisphaera sp. GP187]SIN80745.1 hypothetical protein SAMN05444166_0989 [Singulisphaera sp. GP187]